MQKSAVERGVQSLLENVIRETVRDVRETLPSRKQVDKIDKRLRDLDRRVTHLAKAARTGAPRKGRGGRPRVNPITCIMRGCKDPARAKGVCSRHYQRQRRSAMAARRKR